MHRLCSQTFPASFSRRAVKLGIKNLGFRVFKYQKTLNLKMLLLYMAGPGAWHVLLGRNSVSIIHTLKPRTFQNVGISSHSITVPMYPATQEVKSNSLMTSCIKSYPCWTFLECPIMIYIKNQQVLDSQVLSHDQSA